MHSNDVLLAVLAQNGWDAAIALAQEDVDIRSPRSLGKAHSARQAPRSHNGALMVNAVGGVNSKSNWRSATLDPRSCRAIYGSTDSASEDHANSVLCRALDVVKSVKLHTARHYDGPEYGPNVYRYAPSNGPITESTESSVPTSADSAPSDGVPSKADIAYLLKRATARKMTLVEYCALIGIPLG